MVLHCLFSFILFFEECAITMGRQTSYTSADKVLQYVKEDGYRATARKYDIGKSRIRIWMKKEENVGKNSMLEFHAS